MSAETIEWWEIFKQNFQENELGFIVCWEMIGKTVDNFRSLHSTLVSFKAGKEGFTAV